MPGETTRGSRRVRFGLRLRLMFWLAVFILIVMGSIIALVREQQSTALDKELKERGMALTRALAANCVEPLSVMGAEATLPIMLLVKDVIQTSEDPELGRSRLYARESFGQLLAEHLKRLGRSEELRGVRNEGVIFARVVNPEGRIIAAADAMVSPEAWLDELGASYQPGAGTGLLSPGQGETIWESPLHSGTYVIAVPIVERAAGSSPAGAGSAGTPPAETSPAAAPAEEGRGGRFLGTVYLGMSQNIVRRAMAEAVSKLLLVAAGVLGLSGLIAVAIAHLLVSPIHVLRDGVLAVSAGDFKARVRIGRRDELGDLAASFNDMTRGLEERELIRNAFGTYVSSSVLEEILKNPEAMQLGGARRTVTMVDSDVRGFTSMSSQMSPEEVVSVINAYLDLQTKLVNEYRGYVDRFVGDEVQAVFGVPAESPDDAERAVRCAWAIKQAVARMVEERGKRGLPAPRVGIGVDTGRVVAGNIGAEGAKLDYSIVGEPVGTAKELVDAARDPDSPGGQVILSENTYALVKDLVEVRELPPLATGSEGKTERIFDLVGVRNAGA